MRHIRCAAQAKAKETESSGEGGEGALPPRPPAAPRPALRCCVISAQSTLYATSISLQPPKAQYIPPPRGAAAVRASGPCPLRAGLAEFDDDDLSWADDIDDWDEFWAEDDPYLDKYGLGVVRQGDEVGARVVEPTERARLVYEKLEQLRAKPNFVGLEPFAAQDASVADINPIKPAPLPEVTGGGGGCCIRSLDGVAVDADGRTAEHRTCGAAAWPGLSPCAPHLSPCSPPLPSPSPQLPDLTPWDLRARMEKRRQQELQRLDWARRKSLIGLFPSLDMTGDLRLKPLPSEADREEREWTEEEIWRLITLDGKAVDPRAPGQVAKVLRVYDPEAQSDHPAEGYVEPPSTEEFLEVSERDM